MWHHACSLSPSFPDKRQIIVVYIVNLHYLKLIPYNSMSVHKVNFCSIYTVLILLLILSSTAVVFFIQLLEILPAKAQQQQQPKQQPAEIPSTHNPSLDIAIAIITGGAVTTWLTLFFDNLNRKRTIEIDLTRYSLREAMYS